jgi:nitrous oxide reductase accessory protein NosL
MKVHTSYRRSERDRFSTSARLLVALVALLLTDCSASQAPPQQAAVDIHKGDACAVCGMYIDAGPGPRAEAWVQGYQAPLKFGSTRDFFAYVLDPENKMRLQQLLVQDSATINWQHPSNEARTFVDARTAWYVAWQPLSGEMGPTFASFTSRKEAEVFVRTHGGEILSFSDVTPELTSMIGSGCPTRGSPAFALARACMTAPRSADSQSVTQDERPDLFHVSHSVPHEIDPGLRSAQRTQLDGKRH